MAYTAQQILALASGIYEDINSPSAQSVTYISGVLTSPGFIGDLNNRLTTAYFVTGGAITGDFTDDEGAIAALMYQYAYFKRQALATLQGAGSGWTSIREGDTSISREHVTNFVKGYTELAKTTGRELDIAVSYWKRAHVSPVSVDFAALPAYPSP